MTEAMLLESYLKQLKLPTFLSNWRKVSEDAAQEDQSYEQFLLALAEMEVFHREERRLQRLIKQAHFPVIKELCDFDFSAIPELNKAKVLQLAGGEYIKKVEPIIMLGNTGLGKSHIATGLAMEACRGGHKVRFYNSAELVNELTRANEELRLSRFLSSALRYKLIILDELGFIPFKPQGAQLVFQFCSAIHERVAMIITTNLSFADWIQIFGDERLTAALLDRVTFKAHILEFVGESFRFRQRMKRQKDSKGDT